MFNRSVLINGITYTTHEVTTITHKVFEETRITVVSSTNSGRSTTTTLIHSFQMNLTFAAAEEWVKENELFQEVISEEQEMLNVLLPSLTDEQAIQVPLAWPHWDVDHAYNVGDRVNHNDTVYKCLQAHTSQSDWAPDVAPSLWARLLTPDPDPENPDAPVDILPWEQPDSTNPYMAGDKVTHNDQTWISDIDNNVWEPGIYGWTVVE